MREHERGQTDEQTVRGCGCGVLGLAALIAAIVLGGTWRTDIACTFPTSAAGHIMTFEERLNARHWVAGFVRGEQPDLPDALRRNMQPGDVLQELVITTRHSVLDNILAGVTLAVYTPVTVDVKGKYVRPTPPKEKE